MQRPDRPPPDRPEQPDERTTLREAVLLVVSFGVALTIAGLVVLLIAFLFL